jgi:hypothetical protein
MRKFFLFFKKNLYSLNGKRSRLIKAKLSSLKIKNLNKKIEKYELRLKKINLKKSLNLFYADKFLEESEKPFTYFTKVKIRNNYRHADWLFNKSDRVWGKLKVLYSKLAIYENN